MAHSPGAPGRTTSLQIKTSNTSAKNDEVVIHSGASATVPAGGGSPASGQPVVWLDAGAPVASELIQVSIDGGSTVHRVGGQPLTSTRIGLEWMAGVNGLPDLNATAASDLIDPRFEILGTNASADDVTYSAEGGIVFTTDGADGDEVILLPHLDAGQSVWTSWTWGTDRETVWECWIQTGAAITNSIVWAGLKLTNTEVTATDDDACFFRYEDGVNDGEWQAISAIGGTDDAADSGVVVAVSTTYHLQIVISSARTAKMYINGTLVETTGALTDAVDLIPYIGVAADGAAEGKTLTVFGQNISRLIGSGA